MTIYFNVTDAIGSAPNHGITRTERRLGGALLGRDDVGFVTVRNGQLVAVDDAALTSLLDPVEPGATPGLERFGIDRRSSATSRESWLRVRRRRSTQAGPTDRVPAHVLRTSADDVVVSVGLDWVHGTLDAAERHVFGAGGRFVGMCYDLIPIDHPEWLFPPDPEGFRRYLRRLERASSHVMCISQRTRDDLLRHVPELAGQRSPVIRLGADAARSCAQVHDEFATSLFPGEPYAIYCATLDRRKNHHVLYRAMRRMVQSGVVGNMVFVGRLGSGVDDLVDCLRHDRTVAGRIAHVWDCDDDHLAALYRHAACAVYPSLYEGWGLGVTEALAHGTPCLIASGSSLGEAGLGVCRELHPLRTEQWAEALAAYLAAPPQLPEVDLPTWKSAADQLVEVARS